MNITFHGAARNVTGSKHLIRLNDGTSVLLDCGMFQGMGLKTHELNETLGFDPASISFLLLSHAHIDHSGLIPMLVKRGFTGKIYCTEATRELAEILLYDSAEIQTYETDHINKIRADHNLSSYAPLYAMEDVENCLQLFETVMYNIPFNITNDVQALFINAGHLIGGACIHLTIREGDNKTTVLFSGDVGRYRSMLLQAPATFPQADYIILESTYGATTRQPNFNTIDTLRKWIKKTCLEKKGKLIIPAFSVGRTQEVLYALNQLELEHTLPELRYFVDSPLGAKATKIVKHHMEYFNERLQQVLTTDDDPFDFKGLTYIESAEDSKKLVAYNEPCVIISASGTADAGRVRHHIFNALSDKKNAILFVGFCQEQSLGGQLLSKCKTVELFGNICAVEAETGYINSMSAHGDSDDLLKFISCQDPESVQNVFLVHGEYQTQQVFAAKLERKGFKTVTIPSIHQQYELQPVMTNVPV